MYVSIRMPALTAKSFTACCGDELIDPTALPLAAAASCPSLSPFVLFTPPATTCRVCGAPVETGVAEAPLSSSLAAFEDEVSGYPLGVGRPQFAMPSAVGRLFSRASATVWLCAVHSWRQGPTPLHTPRLEHLT
jgi:hypothetical protein